MSLPVFIRKDNGTAWEGRIAYNWHAKRESYYELKESNIDASNIEEIYLKYSVCPALRIKPSLLSESERLDLVYRFLYGHTLKELMITKGMQDFSLPGDYYYEPEKWTAQRVEEMDWDFFCLAYYSFLSSNTDYDGPWSALKSILVVLNESPSILRFLLAKHGREFNPSACSDFWESVCDGLTIRALPFFCEEKCYKAFQSMRTFHGIFTPERYEPFKRKCVTLLEEIARSRIDKACEEKYTATELSNFNIEKLFFYEEYFAALPELVETKQYVLNKAFTMMHLKGDMFAADGNVLGADSIYNAALKYAQAEEDHALISSKRDIIATAVFAAKSERERERLERERERLEREREQEKEKQRKEKLNKLQTAMAVITFFCAIVAVLFGILSIAGAWRPYSIITLVVFLCLTILGFIVFGRIDSKLR